MRLKFALAQEVWNTSGIYSSNLLQCHYDLSVFRWKAPPGSCAAGTQFPELDHKGSDLVLNCIPIANILICREDDFKVPKICGVILSILECGGYFCWICCSFWRENTLFVNDVFTVSSSWKRPITLQLWPHFQFLVKEWFI